MKDAGPPGAYAIFSAVEFDGIVAVSLNWTPGCAGADLILEIFDSAAAGKFQGAGLYYGGDGFGIEHDGYLTRAQLTVALGTARPQIFLPNDRAQAPAKFILDIKHGASIRPA